MTIYQYYSSTRSDPIENIESPLKLDICVQKV